MNGSGSASEGMISLRASGDCNLRMANILASGSPGRGYFTVGRILYGACPRNLQIRPLPWTGYDLSTQSLKTSEPSGATAIATGRKFSSPRTTTFGVAEKLAPRGDKLNASIV